MLCWQCKNLNDFNQTLVPLLMSFLFFYAEYVANTFALVPGGRPRQFIKVYLCSANFNFKNFSFPGSVAAGMYWPAQPLSWADHALGYHDSHAFSQAISLFSIAGKHLPCESWSPWFWCIGRCKMVWDRNVLRFLFSPLQLDRSYVFMPLFYISVSNLSPSLLCIYSLPHLNILQIAPLFFFPTAVPIILPC